ncbi:hypothetical protein GCM10025791_18860 [Halioxenophilus aromaticivorans]|uniref:Uncharacterized protein n=1 Tax=Halioxenophilus aromaticivorans TaxID=1306992 RepID=A0AAV3U221_9ALTE
MDQTGQARAAIKASPVQSLGYRLLTFCTILGKFDHKTNPLAKDLERGHDTRTLRIIIETWEPLYFAQDS